MRKDEGKEKIINMKNKSMSNIFKKIIACLILIAMFSGYGINIFVAAADNVEEREYKGEYECIYVKQRLILDFYESNFKWNEFQNQEFNDEHNNKYKYKYNYKDGDKQVGVVFKSDDKYGVILPKDFIDTVRENLNATF